MAFGEFGGDVAAEKQIGVGLHRVDGFVRFE